MAVFEAPHIHDVTPFPVKYDKVRITRLKTKHEKGKAKLGILYEVGIDGSTTIKAIMNNRLVIQCFSKCAHLCVYKLYSCSQKCLGVVKTFCK